jgi:ClpP class serine protease
VTLNRLEHPEIYALHGIARTIGEEQKSLREAIKPIMNMLQKGPLSFHEALELGLIDAPMYHQDVLTLLRDEGIKTWSVRKYLDATIAQQIFGDIDRDKWIIPQLRKRSDKEKKSLKEKDGVPGAHLDVKLMVSQPLGSGEPLYGEAVLKVDVVVPRNIGLVYLDSAIEGYKPQVLQANFARKGRFGGEAMAAYILKAAADPSIHSIVLRINSPGGTSFQISADNR